MKKTVLILCLAALTACSAQGDTGSGGAGAQAGAGNASSGASTSAELTANASAVAINTTSSLAGATVSTKASAKAANPCDSMYHPNFDPDKCVLPEERVDKFVGTWRITRVHVSSEGVQAASLDDPSIVGSEFTLSTEELKWTKKASDSFSGSDVCIKPISGPHGDYVVKNMSGPLIAAAKHWTIPASDRAALRTLSCQNGGSWGPESDSGVRMYPVGTNRMIMSWYDGTVLLLNRV